MLLAAGERLVRVPWLAVNRARQGSVGGQAKSDPKDARVIADQLRLRSADFRPITLQDETIAELRLLVSRRSDLVADQTRRISRMRHLLNTIHPDLERTLDLTNAGPLTLLTRYVTAAQIRAARPKTIARILRATARLVREMAEEAIACPPQPSPPPPASPPCCASPARLATTNGRATPTTASSASSTSPPSAPSPTRSAAPSTHTSDKRGNVTTRPSSPSRAAASTCSGRSSPHAGPSMPNTKKPLDRRITPRPRPGEFRTQASRAARRPAASPGSPPDQPSGCSPRHPPATS